MARDSEMDDDALPSSFVTKVLPAQSKWQVKDDAPRASFRLGGERSLRPVAWDHMVRFLYSIPISSYFMKICDVNLVGHAEHEGSK